MTTVEDIPKEIWEIHVDAAKWMGKKLERLFYDKDLPVHWDPPLKDSYSSGSILRLLIDKFGKELTVEIGKNKLELVPGLKFIGEMKQGIRKLKDSSNFNGTQLKEISPSYKHPLLFLECFYKDHNKLVSIIPGFSRIPIPIPEPSSKSDKEIKLTIKATGLEDKQIKFLWQQMTKQTKFLRFLEWQNQLIYGAAKIGYSSKENAYVCTKKAWNMGYPRVLKVSATDKKTHAMVCSPLVATFLGYWLNYNEYFTSGTGKHRTKYIRPTNGDDHINGYSDFLTLEVNTKPLLNKKGKVIPKPKDTSTLGGVFDWRFKEFSEQVKRKPGDIFACAKKGHSFLLVEFGKGFTFPKAYIFGGSDYSDCEEGLYIIQANGPSDGVKIGKGILLSNYFKNRDEEKLNNRIEYYKKMGETKTEAGVTCKEIKTVLEDALEELRNNVKERVRVFNGTKLTTMNGKLGSGNRFDLGEDDKGDRHGRTWKWKFKAWKVNDVLDDNGMIKGDLKGKIPTTFWLKREGKWKTVDNIDLTTHDCRPILNK